MKKLDGIEFLTVKSLANGNMLVEIGYKNGNPGVLWRLTIARDIAGILREHIYGGKPSKPARKAPKDKYD